MATSRLPNPLRTTPYSRTDIYTGDLNTNLYRGLFGRRYQHGEALQVAGQQYGTNPGRTVESSDQLGVLVRVGVGRKRWSADALLLRGDRDRGRTFTDPLRDTIPATQSTRTDAYARFGWGNPYQGAWVQGIASASKFAYGGQKATTSSGAIADTTRYRAQYVLTGGYGRGPIHASVTQRLRTGLFRRVATPSARVGLETRLLTLSALAEELRSAYGIQARAMPADLARTQSCAELVQALDSEGIGIDALVNNAGYGVPGFYRETSWETQRDFIQVLVTAPCELAHRLLPGMTRRGYGRILNVASVAGLMPGSASHTLWPSLTARAYVRSGRTAAATFAVSVHGVVVQTRRLSLGRSSSGSRTYRLVWLTSR